MNSNYKKSFFLVLLLVVFAGLNFSFLEPSNNLTDDKARKTKHCKQILKELATVSGLSSIEIPDIEVVDPLKNQSLAIAMFYDEGNPTIQVHEWTYNICMSLLGEESENGLVFIIAHELAHLLKKHEERPLYEQIVKVDSNDIKNSSKTNENIKRSKMDSLIRSFKGLNSKYNIRKNEAEADLHAGFTAYLAGYDTRRAAAIFFDSTYKYFKLDTIKGKYVSKEERKIIVEGTSKQLDTLIHLFEMANLLTIAGQYDIATHCYKYVNKHYSSPALLNNVGLSLMLEASKDAKRKEIPYTLPFTIKTNLITKEVTRGTNSKIDLRIAKLKEAISYFKRVQISHPNNYEAFLNNSIAEYLIYAIRDQSGKSWEDDNKDYIDYAKIFALKAKISIAEQPKSTKALSDIYMMLAILEHASNNQTEAHKYYEASKDKNPINSLLKLNASIVNSESTNTTNHTNSCDKEAIAITKDLTQLYNEFEQAFDINISLGYINDVDSLRFCTKDLDDGTFYNITIRNDNVIQQYYHVYQTNQNFLKPSSCATTNIDSINVLESIYGPPQNMIQSSSGHYKRFLLRDQEFEDNDGFEWQVTDGIMFYSNNSGLIDHRYIYRNELRQ